MDPELQKILNVAAARLQATPAMIMSGLRDNPRAVSLALSSAQVPPRDITRLQAIARGGVRAETPTIMRVSPQGSTRVMGPPGANNATTVPRRPPAKMFTDPLPWQEAPYSSENWVRPAPEPQPMPPGDEGFNYGPEEGTMPDEEPNPYLPDPRPPAAPYSDPPSRGPRASPGSKLAERLDATGEPQFDEGYTSRDEDPTPGLFERLLGPKTDLYDKGPGKLATSIGEALGTSPTSIGKGLGLLGTLLMAAGGLGGQQAPPPPDPPREDYTPAVRQSIARKEAEPPPDVSQEQMASMTPQQIAEIERKRRLLGLSSFMA